MEEPLANGRVAWTLQGVRDPISMISLSKTAWYAVSPDAPYMRATVIIACVCAQRTASEPNAIERDHNGLRVLGIGVRRRELRAVPFHRLQIFRPNGHDFVARMYMLWVDEQSKQADAPKRQLIVDKCQHSTYGMGMEPDHT